MSGLSGQVPEQIKRKVVKAVPDPVWRRVRLLVHGQSVPQKRLREAKLARLGRQAAAIDSVDVRPVIFAGQGYLAKVVGSYSAADALTSHFALVTEAFDSHGIDYAVLDAQPQKPRVLVVARDQHSRALQALTDDLSDHFTYVAAMREASMSTPGLIGTGDLAASAAVLRVFRVYASASGTYLGGPDVGCDVEFWSVAKSDSNVPLKGQRVAAGSLIAPRSNRWTSVIGPEERQTERRVVDGLRSPVFVGSGHSHLLDISEPIDAVYTWVDGQDPQWQERKRAAQQSTNNLADLHHTAANASRFQSRDELKYSLRSLEMYASWIRHIYVVTDDQIPDWLDQTNPRLTVVSHRELFAGRGVLPTFNSHAIESQLHHIDGLSERYLYLNDDVFFGRTVSPSAFFHGNGLAKFFMSDQKISLGEPQAEDAPVVSAAKNNRRLIQTRFGRSVSNKLQHVPHTQQRSVLFDMEEQFPDQFRQTAASQFRHPDDISIASSLQHYYAYATGRSMPDRLSYFYTDIAHPETPYKLSNLLRNRNFDVFCLNDHDSSELSYEDQIGILGNFLESYFPLKSQFEVTSA